MKIKYSLIIFVLFCLIFARQAKADHMGANNLVRDRAGIMNVQNKQLSQGNASFQGNRDLPAAINSRFSQRVTAPSAQPQTTQPVARGNSSANNQVSNRNPRRDFDRNRFNGQGHDRDRDFDQNHDRGSGHNRHEQRFIISYYPYYYYYPNYYPYGPSYNNSSLSIDDIVDMVKCGIPDDEIIYRIRKTGSVFRLTTELITYLKANWVSNRIIDFMLATENEGQY